MPAFSIVQAPYILYSCGVRVCTCVLVTVPHCQAPIPTTFVSFWRMLWETRAGVVAMLQPADAAEQKCHRFWPDTSATPPQPRLRYGDITVAHTSTVPTGAYVAREFSMRCVGCVLRSPCRRGDESRAVTVYVFTAWPDHGVPAASSDMLQFRNCVRNATRGQAVTVPLVVMCSAGVGRTGTFIAVDRLLAEAENPRSAGLDVRAVVADLRNSRNLMVGPLTNFFLLFIIIIIIIIIIYFGS